MKRIVPLFKRVAPVVLLLWSTTAWAQEKEKEKKKYEFAHERTVSQSYPASSSDKLKLENQFGDVVIKTWSKAEVKVDIKIEVSSNVKEVADQMFGNIQIDHGKDGNTIKFETDMNSKKDKDKPGYKGKHSNTISIDYEVMMPANLALDLENKFGKTTVPDLQGKVNISQQFGNLYAGKLAQPGNIEVKFGGVVIESAVNGKYEFHFTNDQATIKNLSGKADVEVQHCKSSGVVINANNIDELKVEAQHSDVAVVVPKNISAGISVETHFGSFTNKSSFAIKDEDKDKDEDKNRRGPKFNYTYKGTAGSGKNKIEMEGSFSEILISHETPPAKEKKKKVTNI